MSAHDMETAKQPKKWVEYISPFNWIMLAAGAFLFVAYGVLAFLVAVALFVFGIATWQYSENVGNPTKAKRLNYLGRGIALTGVIVLLTSQIARFFSN